MPLKLVILALVAWICLVALYATEPVVSEVTATQRTDGSKIVDIWYDLAFEGIDSVFVSMDVSEDGGLCFEYQPLEANLAGDIGWLSQAGDNLHIEWSLVGEGREFLGLTFAIKISVTGIVDSPVASLTPGIYYTVQSLSLSCSTTGAIMYFTTDGSEPTELSSPYSSPIMINGNTILKIKAIKDGWIASRTMSYAYNIIFSGFEYVSGGSYIMGDSRGSGNTSELPLHSVTLSPFYIGKYEVTQSQWQSVMGYNPVTEYGVGPNHPVQCITWYAVLKYCNLRSIAEGLVPAYCINGSTNPVDWGAVPNSNNSVWDAAICNWNANGYRLPTEAEWEYSARSMSNIPDYLYSGSNDLYSVGWFYNNNSPNGAKAVGTKAPNSLGLYDMSGNIWEWCWDWYAGSYYNTSSADNPRGPEIGSRRVLRGGVWYFEAGYCRVSDRGNDFPENTSYVSYGFRLCRGGILP